MCAGTVLPTLEAATYGRGRPTCPASHSLNSRLLLLLLTLAASEQEEGCSCGGASWGNGSRTLGSRRSGQRFSSSPAMRVRMLKLCYLPCASTLQFSLFPQET